MEADRSRRVAPDLIALPPEILHNILIWVRPTDLAVTIPRVCRTLYAFTKGNRNLWRQYYLGLFDVPRDAASLDWEREVSDVLKLEAICNRSHVSEKEGEIEFVHDMVMRLLQHASPAHDDSFAPMESFHPSRNARTLATIFRRESTREAFLQQSVLFQRVRTRSSVHAPSRKHQLSAKLHCLFSCPIFSLGEGRTRSHRTYPVACSIVYDLRRYTQRTRWGPFMDDGSDNVDWEKLEAILIVLGHNIGAKRLNIMFREVWETPFGGSWPGSYKSLPPPSSRDNETDEADDVDPALEANDPYGVTGTWYQVVCFLDYNDFFSYNFPVGTLVEGEMPRPPLDVAEATRLIVLKIHVTSIEPPGPDDGQALPVVHFGGVSRSLDDSWDDNANSDIRGTVRLTREGEVRWTTFSIFHGQERWRSEGVQLGGVRAARGVFGNWFDRDYDDHGPAGPTAFWKKPSTPSNPNVGLFGALPNDFFVAYGNLIGVDSDSDPEAEMPYNAEEDDDVEDEEDEDLGSVDDELPGLLQDAEMEVQEVVPQNVEQV